MSSFKDMLMTGDDLNIGSYEDTILFAPAWEFTNNPKTKDKLSTPSTAPGASVEIGEDYTFTTATGKGYWRKLQCITGTVEGDITDGGDAGTLSSENMLKGKVRGMSSIQTEFFELLGSAGGIVVLALDKSDGKYREFGTPTSPAMKKSLKGGNTPKSRGFEFELQAIGRAPRILDPVAFPPDTTPNS